MKGLDVHIYQLFVQINRQKSCNKALSDDSVMAN